ncbi:MAG: glutamine--fructose-6-phosphate transaminase (isomerizing) [Eubacteriaceae bacterium]|nr:glutamine--fructose-6-phosphate transaminase (isomerizing) [Eubacteriaceae bacterium]
MCGIVGYVGYQDATDILLNGLAKLDYRGYDSAGIALVHNNQIKIDKYKGKLEVLAGHLEGENRPGKTGIGHTRWATHGKPSDANAHPHPSEDMSIAVVHNGIVENYKSLKNELIENGVTFASETDTEVISHLVRSYFDGNNILEAVSKTVKRLKGAYALCICAANEPGKIVAVKKDNPLIIGIGENENFVASDVPAIIEHTRQIYTLSQGTIALVTADSVELFDEDLNPITAQVEQVTWSAEAATKAGYEHFMLKEIYEQPDALQNTFGSILDGEAIEFEDFPLDKELLSGISRIYMAACGTAYYAASYGKQIIEKIARIPVEIDVASEFRYKNPIISEDTLFVAVSQSGETADTLESLRLATTSGAKVLSITNVIGSAIDRETRYAIHTNAGPEIAVASTKAFTTQVICLYLLAIELARLSGKLTPEEYKGYRKAAFDAPEYAKSAITQNDAIKEIALKIAEAQSVFFIGRGVDFCCAQEGSLKLKELSYIHAEAYQSGELKHGPIALLQDGSPVIAVCTQSTELFDKTLNNIKEVKARGAYVFAIAKKHMESEIIDEVDDLLLIDDGPDELSLIPAAIALQLLAYHTAVALERDVDKPRNLAKSVTVE